MSDTRQVAIIVRIGEAREVVLAGDFPEPIRLVEDRPGCWRATVELPLGRHAYKLFVDGQVSREHGILTVD